MKLLVSPDEDADLAPVIRRVFEGFPGDEVVEMTRDERSTCFCWSGATVGRNRSVTLCIPNDWLDDPDRAGSVEQAARAFADRVMKEMEFGMEDAGACRPMARENPEGKDTQ